MDNPGPNSIDIDKLGISDEVKADVKKINYYQSLLSDFAVAIEKLEQAGFVITYSIDKGASLN